MCAGSVRCTRGKGLSRKSVDVHKLHLSCIVWFSKNDYFSFRC